MTLWGFADLHAHPASHLGFGAEINHDGSLREPGIFWGKPGLSADEVDLADDLQPCDGDMHTVVNDGGPIREGTRRTVISTIRGLTDHPHQSAGWPSLSSWPHARSLMHQQMHVTWIRRAWQGGLRLMIASVTDNQTLAMLWHRLGSSPQPVPNPNFDYESARVQLAFIRNMAHANSTWMEIVTSPAGARQAIGNNKLALILSLEMDSLTVEQIVALKDEFGVRHVTPIHMANNSFGGVAVYNDVFNTNNQYLNGTFLEVDGDPALQFRLSHPQRFVYLTNDPFLAANPNDYIAYDLLKSGAMELIPIRPHEYETLGYPTHVGHKNLRGLDKTRLEMLMRHGIIIDLAHMSERSQEDTLALAVAHRYPVMNSHTGIRPEPGAGEPASDSERGIRRDHVRTMAGLGGVIGLGTSREERSFASDENPMQTWITNYRHALAANAMNGRGVALGTDMNGFAPQIPFSRSNVDMNYPVTIGMRLASPEARSSVVALDRHTVGGMTFDIRTHGIAHYGMIPDFIQAIYDTMQSEGREDAEQLVAQLFHTAEDVVQMWERVEEAARDMGLATRPSGTVALDLYWNSDRGDNFSTATDTGRSNANGAGYRFVRTEGYVFSARRPETVPLDLFWSAERGDNFLTATDAGRNDANAAEYQAVRTEGFIFSSQQPGTVPLNLYWSEARADNFITATEAGKQDAEAARYRFVRVEGYVFPRAIALRAHNGQYIGVEGGGGSTVDASRPWIREYETFEVIYLAENKIALRTHNGYYLSAEDGGGRELVANRTWIGDWEDFDLVHVGGSRIALRVHNGQYVSAEGGGGREVVANRSSVDIWETFELIGA